MLYSSGTSFSYKSMGHSNWLALHGVNLNLKIVWATCSFLIKQWSQSHGLVTYIVEKRKKRIPNLPLTSNEAG